MSLIGQEYPFAMRYERKIRDEDPHQCDYCHRDATYMVALGQYDDRLGFEADEVCDIHYDEHHSDTEIVSVLRQSGAYSEGRWGDYE